jgi:putative flippase GtrA
MKANLKKLPESNKQAIKFVIIGILAVLTDIICYFIVLQMLPEIVFGLENEMVAKAISFLCGFSVTYTLNNRWTWRKTDHTKERIIKSLILYSISLAVNVFLNSFFLELLEKQGYINYFPFSLANNILAFVGIKIGAHLFAIILTTGFTAVFNFLGQKFWVFADKKPDETEETLV